MALHNRSLKGTHQNLWYFHVFLLSNFRAFYYPVANGSVLYFVYFELVEDNVVLSQWLNVNILWATSTLTVACLEEVTHGCSVKDCSEKNHIIRKKVHVIKHFFVKFSDLQLETLPKNDLS